MASKRLLNKVNTPATSTAVFRSSGKNAVVVFVQAKNWNASEVTVYLRSELSDTPVPATNGVVNTLDKIITLGVVPSGIYVSAEVTGAVGGDAVSVLVHG